MEADRKLDKRHAIEDAMTAALVRKCPKCAKPYLKEGG
jgi:TRIAD3 protein (E3 ubiquitin-protein ligase RNF216)